MAFTTTQSEFDALRRLIAEQFPADECDEIYALVKPFVGDHGTRLAECILHLARGKKSNVGHYAECVRQDPRDVIFWAENPREAAIDTPEKIDEFQHTLKWLGLPQDPELKIVRDKLVQRQEKDFKPSRQRSWWRFW